MQSGSKTSFDAQYQRLLQHLTLKGLQPKTIAHSVVCCLRAAGNPWNWEMSQLRFQHLVADVDLQHAVRAGVNEVDIGRDYLELRLE